MKPLLLALCGVLIAIAPIHRGTCAPPCDLSAKSESKQATLTVPVRVHLVQSAVNPAMHTTLAESDVRRIFGKANMVWSQADRKSTRLNSSHLRLSRMPSSA